MPQDPKTHQLREKLRSELKSLADEIGESYPENGLICHYTTPEGLYGIIESGALWATNISFLNDPEEFRFAYREFEAMISENTVGLDPRVISHFIEGTRLSGEEEEVHRQFIISFSSLRDDLNQFRAYSNDGSGYSLVFDAREVTAAINKFLKSDDGRSLFTLRKGRYGTAELRALYIKVLYQVKTLISNLPSEPYSTPYFQDVRALGLDCADFLREAATVFKQEGYRVESEYRAILETRGYCSGLSLDLNEQVKTRLRSGVPVPYIPIQFASALEKHGYYSRRATLGGLREITIGPGIDVSLAKRGINYLLRKNGIVDDDEAIEIKASSSSYRRSRI